MARAPRTGKKQLDSANSDEGEANEAVAAPAGIPGSFRVWFDEHWHGWIKSVALIVGMLAAYLLYTNHLIPEASAGLLLIALIVGGAIYSAAETAFDLLPRREHKLLLAGFLVVWAFGAGLPPLLRAFPRQALGEAVTVASCSRYADPDNRECAEPRLTATATLDGSGPFEILISGQLKGQGEAEATYHLALASADGGKEEIEGTLRRLMVRERTSRRSAGGGVVVAQEHTEAVHRLALRGKSITITAEGVEEALESGFKVSFRPAGLPPLLFLLLGGLCLLVGILLDYRFYAPKVKTYFATAAGLTLLFAAYYAEGIPWGSEYAATPHNLVRPAIGGLVWSTVGALAGWLISAVVKSYKKLPPKLSPR